MLTQYGVCCFRYDDEGRLEARPFNSFILPSTKFGRDRVYSCQQSSMAFLSQHGFDFNAWIADGVSFLSRAEEAAIEAKLKARWVRDAAAAAEKQEAAEKGGAVAVAATPKGKDEPLAAVKAHTTRDGKTFETLDGDQQAMILDALKKVEDLVEEATSGGEYTAGSLKFDPMGGKDRWLMFEFVGSTNPAIKLSVLKGAYAARGIEARTVCPDPKLQAIAEEKLRAEAEAKQLEDLRRAAGFRRVVDVISKAGKPVITHNGLLDLVHTHDKFVGPVPADLDEGTQALHALFPLLMDNKVVMTSATAAGLQFPRTTLGEGHQWLRTTFPQQPKVAEAEVGVTAEAEADSEVKVGAAAAAAVEPGPANGQAEVAVAVAEDAAAAAAAAVVPHPLPTNGTDGDGDKVSPPGGGGGAEVEVVAGGDGEKGDAAAAAEEAVAAVAAAEAAAVEAELKRRAWDATFAPGFEERYAAGGQEHEAGFDAYLTGCCFAAAATLGLGVGVEELKGMASGGEVPAALSAVSNVVPLFRILGGQRICLPGPAPPLDLSCYVHVSGFPSAARTDAIMRPLKAVEGCDSVWFHWIDDTSGLAECPSAEGARALLEAAASSAAAAASAAAGAGGGDGGGAAAVTGAASAAAGSEPPPRTRVVDPTQLVLEDMKLVQLDSALLYGDDDGQKEYV